jgi:hypothetical protein
VKWLPRWQGTISRVRLERQSSEGQGRQEDDRRRIRLRKGVDRRYLRLTDIGALQFKKNVLGLLASLNRFVQDDK